jgi:uncharacterized protein
MGLFSSSHKTFLKAAAAGDLNELDYCLKNLIPGNFSADLPGGDGETALILAAKNGQLAAVKALLAGKPDLEAADAGGNTALLSALKQGKSAAALLLIAAGANVNTHDENYASPLLQAARDGDLDVVKQLAGAKAELDAISKFSGRTGLHWAVENEHGPVVEFLVAAGARTDIADRKGETPFDVARKQSLPRILKLMEAALPRAPSLAPAAPDATSEGETWTLLGKARVAQVGTYASVGRKLTEIFNFENRERVLITENLKTGVETMGQPEKFETLGAETVQRAEDKFRALGGEQPAKKSLNL